MRNGKCTMTKRGRASANSSKKLGDLRLARTGVPSKWITVLTGRVSLLCVCVHVFLHTCVCRWPTQYHAINNLLIYWIVSQSTIVRLFSCYRERNVNQCILNGSASPMFSCYTERNVNQCILNGRVFQTRESVCADSTVHPLGIYIYTVCQYFMIQRTQLTCSTKGNERKRERERERGFRRGVRR